MEKYLQEIKPLKTPLEKPLIHVICLEAANSRGSFEIRTRQTLNTDIFAITQGIKNPHEEFQEKSLKNNISKFHGKI